jgi:Holliday junction resolvasome RuvABC endonuclease subunit
MIALGLDPSLTGFGWCVHNSEVVGEGRVLAKGVIHTTSKEIFVSRYITLRSELIHLIERFPAIQAVGAESPPYGEQYSEGLYALFVYVNEALYLCRKNVVYFDPKTLKMLAKMDPSVRRGTMDKSDMIEAAKADTKIKRWNNDEADAYLVARSAARFWEFETGLITAEDLTPSEAHSFHRVHTFVQGKKAGQTERHGLIFREDDRFYRFEQVPPESGEEEFRKWLSQRSFKKLEARRPPPKPRTPHQ